MGSPWDKAAFGPSFWYSLFFTALVVSRAFDCARGVTYYGLLRTCALTIRLPHGWALFIIGLQTLRHPRKSEQQLAKLQVDLSSRKKVAAV